MVDVRTVCKVTGKAIGFTLGVCACTTVELVVNNNLPDNLNKFGKVVTRIGAYAVGRYVGDKIEEAFDSHVDKIFEETVKKEDYIEVNVDEAVSA